MKKRFLSVLLVSAMGVAALAGCGGGNTSADNGSTAADQMGAAVEDKTDAADTQKEDTSSSNEKLVVYTNSGTEGRDAYLIEKAKEAGFDIEVVALGASEVTERMIAEKNNPLCDVTFGLNNIEYEKLKANGLLQKWEPDWVDGVDADLIDPDGDLGISDEGWEIAAKFLGNAHNIADGEDAVGSVIDGTYPMDEHWASGVLTEQKDRDYKFQIMTPDIGEPYVVESLAISAGTKKYDTCVAFLNWLGSSDVQLDWSNNYGTIPCQKEALAQVSDDIKELMETLKPQDLDWSFIAENVDAWVEKAELEYVQ